MNAVAGENEFKSLTIPHLKTCLNAEYDTFKKATLPAVLDHHEEENKNLFYQLMHDSAKLLNIDKHQSFGMQFIDTKFHHNNAITFSFRKKISTNLTK